MVISKDPFFETILPGKNFKGVNTVTHEDLRWKRRDIKTVNLLPNIIAANKAKKMKAYEAILLQNGKVTEGTSSNIWIIKKNNLITHPANTDILKGVTRTSILTGKTNTISLPVTQEQLDLYENSKELIQNGKNGFLFETGNVDALTSILNELIRDKSKLSYYSNVLIVSDPAHPENEGQVKLFKFGKKIFDKITEAMQPEFDDETPINPFDFWKGANFKLKIRKVDGFWNYDKSEFEGVSAIADNDDSIKAIWEKQYPLKPFLDADNFKSYEELKEKLNRVITGTKSTDTVENVDLPSTSTGTVQSKDSASTASASDSDDTLDYFSKLAEE